MIKALIVVFFMGLSLNAAAESASFDTFSIELPPGWVDQIERSSPPDSDFNDRISVSQPDGAGTLHLQTYTAAAPVDESALRLLTNVPATELLENREWGDYSGYQYDYIEDGVYHRTWWLARDTSVLFITYECGEGRESLEMDDVEQIVLSLSSATPR